MSSEDPALAGVTQFQAAGQAGRTHSGYSLSLEGLLAALSLFGDPCSYLIGATGSQDA